MVAKASQDDILKYAIQILKRYRLGFEDCEAEFVYRPMTDDIIFHAIDKLYFKYNLGNLPKYDDFLLAIVPVWSDPIC
jgi:hypothetical protein